MRPRLAVRVRGRAGAPQRQRAVPTGAHELAVAPIARMARMRLFAGFPLRRSGPPLSTRASPLIGPTLAGLRPLHSEARPSARRRFRPSQATDRRCGLLVIPSAEVFPMDAAYSGQMTPRRVSKAFENISALAKEGRVGSLLNTIVAGRGTGMAEASSTTPHHRRRTFGARGGEVAVPAEP